MDHIKTFKLILFVVLLFDGAEIAYSQNKKWNLSVTVCDSASRQPLSGVSISLVPMIKHAEVPSSLSNATGNSDFILNPDIVYILTAQYMGYSMKQVRISYASYPSSINLFLFPISKLLREVVITARELHGLTSTSQIGRDAMQHLQPSSFTDLLELLPGGYAQTPSLTGVNAIRLREASTSALSNYETSSLGTAFVIDGVSQNEDANLQELDTSSPDGTRSSVNRGIDMRTISTDNIEKVDIVRGIPSVEYGNLTSGLVKIDRIARKTPFMARFKSDEYSKLYSMGKGFYVGKWLLNTDLSYLNSKEDPRNSLENYQRITFSLRANRLWKTTCGSLLWTPAVDYTGSIDDSKVDPEISLGRDDKYKSSYAKFQFSSRLLYTSRKGAWRSLEIIPSLSYQADRIYQHRYVSSTGLVAIATNMDAGEHDAVYLPSSYTADVSVTGRPFNAGLKIKSEWLLSSFGMLNRIDAGANWDYMKNYGTGLRYDLSRPLSVLWDSRPYSFNSIPGMQNLYLFAEDNIAFAIGKNHIRLAPGIGLLTRPGIARDYMLHGKWYADPRVNMRWAFPSFKVYGKPFNLALSGGYGVASRMPTLEQLYPQKWYNDIVEMNYYNANAAYRRAVMQTYITDVTNYHLGAARNYKWEVTLDADYQGNSMTVTYFMENMADGFRSVSRYMPFTYKKYDTSTIDGSTLTSQPDISNLSYAQRTILNGYSFTENGSKVFKRGLEFQLRFRRIRSLHTGVTFNGGWYRTTYVNSIPEYSTVSTVINNTAVSDQYVGLYRWNDGYVKDRFNTNLILDTQLPKLGLIFSTSVQVTWYTASRREWQDGTPIAYLSTDGILHAYTSESAKDAVLQWLTKSVSNDLTGFNRVPISGFINLKATKEIGRIARLALFVNQMIDYTPDYTSNGITVRRNLSPYFGMELNFNF